jgi:hypothetical protein
MDSPIYDNLNEEGYLIIPEVLSNIECKILKDSLIKAAVELVFIKKGFNVDSKDPEAPKLFTDMKLRKSKLGETAGDAVWRNGNTRDPLISKNCGMINIHFNKELLNIITFNTLLYKEASKVMGTPYLVHSCGPERFSIKAPGSVDMPQHIDSNLFNDSINYNYRIQSLITIDVDNTISLRDSGTLCLLTYFHHYWEFARELFHPNSGLIPMKEEMMKSRFFILPSDKQINNDFNRDYLPKLKKYASIYFLYLYKEVKIENKKELQFFEKIKTKKINFPKFPYIEKMEWKPIKSKPGDIIFWHQYLPHQSLRNKSKSISRICAYYSLFPVTPEWYGTENQKWVEKQFNSCEFYYGANEGNYNITPKNIEELEILKKYKNIDNIVNKFNSTQFYKRISGRESWWSQNYSFLKDSLDIENDYNKFQEERISKYNQLVFKDKNFSYLPNLISEEYANCLTDLVSRLKEIYSSIKNILISDLCFGENRNKSFIKWSNSPKELLLLKEVIELYFKFKVDYVICHSYKSVEKNHRNLSQGTKNILISIGVPRNFEFYENISNSTNLEFKPYDSIFLKSKKDIIFIRNSCSLEKKYSYNIREIDISELVYHIENSDSEIVISKEQRNYKDLRNIIKKNNIDLSTITLEFIKK